jgi:hypothetical protein
MKHVDTGLSIRAAAQRHLEVNEHLLQRRNIIVHVDAVSPSQHAAFCTVEQRHRGWLWHTCSVEELAWRAEQALAPLMSIGILPMITVKHRSLRNATAATPQRLAVLHHWFGKLKTWSGLPFGDDAKDATTLGHDPFGWRSASALPARKTGASLKTPVEANTL